MMADWDDDYEVLPTAPLPTATLTRPRSTPPRAPSLAAPASAGLTAATTTSTGPAADTTPLSTSEIIHDNGAIFGLDPDFADTTHDSADGTAYAIPHAVDVLRVPEPAKRRIRRTTATRADTDETLDATTSVADESADAAPLPDRKLARQQRIENRRAARAEAAATHAQAAEEAQRDAPPRPPRVTATRIKRVVAATAFVGTATGLAVIGWNATFGRDAGTPPAAESTSQIPTAPASPRSPVLAAGDRCIPGQLPDGRLISNGSVGRASGPQTIASMDSAYYGGRDATAVASHFAPSMRVDARAMQRDITSYLPPTVQVSYCMQIAPTARPDVYDVDLIESRGSALKTIRQTITASKQAAGSYLITEMIDR